MKNFLSRYEKYETHEKYIIYILTKSKNFQSKEQDVLKIFQDIMKINLKSPKIRLIVSNLYDKNVKLITKLSNIINVEGIIIKKR